MADARRLIAHQAEEYLGNLDEALVRPRGATSIDDAMPEQGIGSIRALSDLVATAMDGAVQSSGPRYFHFVTGGVTPAALGADWLTSTLDQMGYNWTSLALCVPPGAGEHRMAEGPVRASGGLECGHHDRRDDGQLRRARRGAEMVGPGARLGCGPRWPGGSSGCACLCEWVPTRQRGQGSGHARSWEAAAARGDARRNGPA